MEKNNHLHIGMQNIKTALAATLCALLYLPFQENPTFACIGAIFGMGSDMQDSRRNGGNRFFGTLIGGVIGMALFRLYIVFVPTGEATWLLMAFLFVGVVGLILVSQAFHWVGAIQPGGVVLCILLFNTPVQTYITYSLERIFDTGVGVVVALAVNRVLSRERIAAVRKALTAGIGA